MVRSVNFYQSSSIGNQSRLNYSQLTNSVGNTIVKRSFEKMMSENQSILYGDWIDFYLEDKFEFFIGRQLKRGFHQRPYFGKPAHDPKVRQRAVYAMLDLCQTLDPTLACLYHDNPELNALQKTWRSSCVGPKSTLCRTVHAKGGMENLIPDAQYQDYFRSLCRIPAPDDSNAENMDAGPSTN
jgi:hypothetical protein